MLKCIKVRDYTAPHQLTFKASTDLFTAIALLLEHRLSGAPVVDGEGRLLGMLGEADCLRGILSGAYFEDAHGTAGDLMSSDVLPLNADSDIITAAELLSSPNCEQLPVVDAGKLIGQISRHDILRAVRNFAQNAAQSAD